MPQWITSQPEVDWTEVSGPNDTVAGNRPAFYFKLTGRRVAATVDVLVTNGSQAFDDVSSPFSRPGVHDSLPASSARLQACPMVACIIHAQLAPNT